ncbi:MAG: hypothetical protein VX294_01765 [Candidatus Latescibacterota bacterium]|nr:hypothetical protein [Candidatus Latescibacterota bacterium]
MINALALLGALLWSVLLAGCGVETQWTRPLSVQAWGCNLCRIE